MPTPRVALGERFLEAFAAIPRSKQKKVMDFVAKFRVNPRAPGIHYEKLHDAADPNFRSVRIDREYRGIVLQPAQGDLHILLWVDKHDAAYAWARRHRCAIHPHTGALQILETQDVQEMPPPSAATPSAPQAPPLFAELTDEQLLRLGVPEERLELVKGLTSVEALESIERRLPVEAFEALYLLAAGTPLAEILRDYAAPADARIDVDDFAGALQRDVSKRWFHVVEDELELRDMLQAPLETWRVFLHPSQRRLVERDWNGPVRVLGGAGTGKTVVAMYRARWLARCVLRGNERLLLTTFSRNLAVDIQENLKKICRPEELERIEVSNLDAWISRFLRHQDYPLTIVYPGDQRYEECWANALQMRPAEPGLPDRFFREEWERVILPQRITSKREYALARRTGRGVPLNRMQRLALWPVFEEMRIQLARFRLTTIQDAAHAVIDLLGKAPERRPYRAVVVDEAQDFGREMMTLIRHLAPPGRNDLFIVGDAHQRIYQRPAPLSQAGIEIRGRGHKLRINYRTTEEIRRFATAVLAGETFDDLDEGQDATGDDRSLVHGEPPQLQVFATLEAEGDWIAGQIRKLTGQGLAEADICVVCRTKACLERIGKQLERRGIASVALSRDRADDRSLAGVRLATMHRVKGLEFKVVFAAALTKGVVPLEQALAAASDPVEVRQSERQERALFHVAATRAVQRLYLSAHGEPSPFLTVVAGQAEGAP